MTLNLTLRNLIDEAKIFCELMSAKNHVNLIGVTDGKAVGTYVEHEFKNYLRTRYVCLTIKNKAIMKRLIELQRPEDAIHLNWWYSANSDFTIKNVKKQSTMNVVC